MKKKKNNNYKVQFNKAEPKSNRNVLIISFISVFVAIAVIIGVIFGAIAISKNSKAAFKYEGATMSEELASFFVSYYKYEYLAMLKRSGVTAAEDTSAFWSTKCNSVNTYGEFLEHNTREYIKQIIVANYLFDNYARLTAAEKRDISLAAEEILDYYAEGSVDKFNEETAEYGFTYSVFNEASKMLYKATVARSVIFGADGSKISSDTDSCNEFLSQYSRVKLLFIRTSDRFALDENGNRILGSDGNDTLIPLTDEERAERTADIEAIRAAIAAITEDGDVQMSPELFNHYLGKYSKDGDSARLNDGYYFYGSSAFTTDFAKSFSDIVDKSMNQMTIGDFAEVTTDFGVCFIYKCDVESGAYFDREDDSCFLDFFELAAVYTFDKMLSEFSKDVVVKDGFDNIDIIGMPYNDVFYPRF